MMINFLQQSIKQAMEAAITATNSKLSRQAEIREKKVYRATKRLFFLYLDFYLTLMWWHGPQVTLMRLIDVIKSVEKLERLLKVTTPQDKGARASEIDVLAEKYSIYITYTQCVDNLWKYRIIIAKQEWLQ